MQIQNINSAQNNYSVKQQPNFTAIKSIKCEGLYKKYPELADVLIQNFSKNEKAMDFCRKYDVNIVFHAAKTFQDSVRSTINIFVDNIYKSKFRKIMDKIVESKEDRISLDGFGNKYSIKGSIEQSTCELINVIRSPKILEGRHVGGMLDSHLEYYDNKVEAVLSKKAAAIETKAKEKAETINSENQLNDAKKQLKNSIDKLLNNSK